MSTASNGMRERSGENGPRSNGKRQSLVEEISGVVGPDVTIDLAAGDVLLKTGEVALLFGSSERSVRDWADAGKLPCIRTLGGHRLFPAKAVVEAMRKASARWSRDSASE